MSQITNRPTPNSPAHQLSIQRDSGFIPLALVAFVGLAGIAAWLGQPMLCDLCIAEVFFIGNQVSKAKSSQGIASQPRRIEAGHLEVKIAEKEVHAEISEIVERGQVHSEKAATPEIPLPVIQPEPASPLPEKITTSEDVTIATEEVKTEEVATEEVVAESPKALDLPEETVAVVTAPPEIPEVEDIAPASPVSLPANVEVSLPEPPVAPLETQTSEPVTSNPVLECVEYIAKKPYRVSFATPPTPPTSPPRETFAIPAGLRLPPVPVPSSILTPPLSPQIPPIDYFIGIEEGVLEKGKEQDEIKALDDDWEERAHELVQTEADNSSDHSVDAEEAEKKVKTEEEKQLRDQIREAFEEDLPVVTHIIEEKKPEQEIRDEEAMEDSMVIVTLPEASTKESPATKASPPDSPQLPPRTEDDEPTMISLSQQKPALIILTRETEESRVIYDATNSRLPSFDARAPITPSPAISEAADVKTAEEEEKAVELVAAPVIAEKAVEAEANIVGSFAAPVASEKTTTTIASPSKNSAIIFSDPFASASTSLENTKQAETKPTEIIMRPVHDIIIPSPKTELQDDSAIVRGPYIEVDGSEDDTSSAHAVPEGGKKTSDELMDEITEILHKDNAEVKATPDATEKALVDATQIIVHEVAEKIIPEATQDITPPAAPSGMPEVPLKEVTPAPRSEAIQTVEPVKTEEIDTLLNQSKVLPTLLVTTPMIPEDEELVLPDRKADVARPPSSGSKFPSRPSTAKSSGSEAGGSSSSIDFNGSSSSSLQRSASAPGTVVRTANSSGDPTLFSSETNANAPATPAGTEIMAQKEVLPEGFPEGKEVKRLTKIVEELGDWVDVAAEVERGLETDTVLIEEKDNHFISEKDQYARETREQHANEKKAQEKANVPEKATEKNIKAIAPIESTPKRPFPTPLQIQTPPKVYNPVPETDYFRTIPRVPSLAQKSGSRRVHFDIDDMVAPDSPMFILPIPPSVYGDRPGSRDSAFSKPTSRDSTFSSLSNLHRSLDSINFPSMPKFPPLAIAPRMEPPIIVRDTMSVRDGASEIGVNTGARPSGDAMKYYNSGQSDWGNSIDLERGTFHGAKSSHDFAKNRDIAEWVNITREAKSAPESQHNQERGALLPLHRSPTESEGQGPPRRRWTLLRALSIPFSAFRSTTDSPRSPSTPNSSNYPRTPDSSAFATFPRENLGFLPQFAPQSPQSPLTPASPHYPSSTLIMSPVSPLSPVDPIEPIIPNPHNQPLPIRFLKKLSPKGLLSGASGAAKKAWGLVKYFTSPTPTHAPVQAASGVMERKQSLTWLRGLDEMESGGAKMEATRNGVIAGPLIDFGDEERRSRAREAGKRAAREGVKELRDEVVVIRIPTA